MIKSNLTNFDDQRKAIMKSLLTSIGLATVLATPAFGTVDWGFGNNGNTPDAGSGTATITVGAFGSGWHDGASPPWSIYGASGFWDLGQNGTIRLAGFSDSGSLSLQVVQYVDSMIFTGNLTYQLLQGGSVLQSGSFSPLSGPTPGLQQWSAHILNVVSGNEVLITAPNGGALFDRVVLASAPEPATMLAGAMLLIPFGLSTWYALRRKQGGN